MTDKIPWLCPDFVMILFFSLGFSRFFLTFWKSTIFQVFSDRWESCILMEYHVNCRVAGKYVGPVTLPKMNSSVGSELNHKIQNILTSRICQDRSCCSQIFIKIVTIKHFAKVSWKHLPESAALQHRCLSMKFLGMSQYITISPYWLTRIGMIVLLTGYHKKQLLDGNILEDGISKILK